MEAYRTGYQDLKGAIEAALKDGYTEYKLKPILEDIGQKVEHEAVGISYYHGYDPDTNQIELQLIMKKTKDDSSFIRKRITLTVQEFFGLFKGLSFLLMDPYVKHDHILHIEKIEEL